MIRTFGQFSAIVGFFGIIGLFAAFVLLAPLVFWGVISPETAELFFIKGIASFGPIAFLLYLMGYLIGDWYDHEDAYHADLEDDEPNT